MSIFPASPPQPTNESPAFRRVGVLLGLLVFLLGIALLALVFVKASAFFELPPPPLPAVAPTPVVSATADAATAAAAAANAAPSPSLILGQSLAHFLQKLLVLFVMCVAGSLIAGRGIEMFFRSINAVPHVPVAPQAAPPSNP